LPSERKMLRRTAVAIAAVLEGASREEAAKIGGMDRQTLRDWVIRFNEQGADGLINIPSPGMPPKLNAIHKAFLARIVEEGPSLRSMAWCAGGRPIWSYRRKLVTA
jgi:transposase